MTPVATGDGPSEQDLRNSLPKDRGSRQLRIGLFVILGIISFFTVLFLLTDPGTFRGRYDVFTRLSDAGGVRRGDPIQMRGVIIGRVSGFEMAPDGLVNITLEIEGEWQIPQQSTVELAEAGLFGGRTVEVIPSEATAFIAAGDTINGADQGGGLMAMAGDLAGEAEVLMGRLTEMLDSSTVQSVRGTSEEVLGLTRDLRSVLAEQRTEIAQLTSSLNRTASGLEEAAGAGSDVAGAAAKADSLMAQLNTTTERLDTVLASLDTVIGRMARGEGTLGRLSADESLYVNMDSVASSLNALLVDLKANPGRYLTVEIF